MNRQLIKLWLVAVLAVVAFPSCRKDARTEPRDMPTEQTGQVVVLLLSAEVGFEEDNDLKGLDFKLENVNGKMIPRPKFLHGDEVEVHTILKGSDGTVMAKTLKWTYDANHRKLYLRQGVMGNSFTLTNFNNESGRRWYIAGLLAPGTSLSETHVNIQGTRQLQGVNGNVGDELGHLNVPYWFGWTELTMEMSKDVDSNGYRYAVADNSVAFRPLGSLIAIKLGNKLTTGSYTFTPTGFTLMSNAYGDKGSFNLNIPISGVDPSEQLPLWTEESSAMSYTFAPGYLPSPIAHNGNADKTYYAWVMLHSEQPASVETRIMLKGTSSRPETPIYKDYTKTYFTDYRVEGKASGGKPTSGKIQLLKANVTQRLALPIEYVTEYNLAGGAGLSATVTYGTQPAGTQGPLRISKMYDNLQSSGYYNSYKLLKNNNYHATYNPHAVNLRTPTLIEVNDTAITLGDKYRIPELSDWWGVFPNSLYTSWTLSSHQPSETEFFKVGDEDADYINFSGMSYFSSPRYPYGTDDTSDAVIYAIRFARKLDEQYSTYHFYSEVTPRIYYPTPDNALRCAYRYQRVGGRTNWSNLSLTNQFVVEVVYLGEEPIALNTIRDEAWWNAQRSAGKVFKRIFPVAGQILNNQNPTIYYRAEGFCAYKSSSRLLSSNPTTNGGGLFVYADGNYFDGTGAWSAHWAQSVRLWKKDPDVQ